MATNMVRVHASRCLLVLLFAAISSPAGNATEGKTELREGRRFEVIGTLYAHGVRDDPGSSETTVISVVPLRLSGPEIACRQLVPAGSILTITSRPPARLLGFLYPQRYVVHISSMDAPPGVPW